MRDAEPFGDRARVADVLPGAAAARPADRFAMVVELQRDADDFGVGARGKAGDDARIDAARHRDDDTAAPGAGGKVERIFHDGRPIAGNCGDFQRCEACG